jgi:hypothetical protein
MGLTGYGMVLTGADCGEAVLLDGEPGNGPRPLTLARRFDAQGGISAPLDVSDLSPIVAMAPRGEAWLVNWSASASPTGQVFLRGVRWRPGLAPESARVLATGSVTDARSLMAVAVDDSGRATMVWSAGPTQKDLHLFAVRFE